MRNLWAPWRMEYILSEKPEGCIFCEAYRRPDHLVVHRTERALVMMNRYPYTNGHLLVAPRRHVAGLEDLSAEEARELFECLRRSVEALRRAFGPHGFNIGANLGRVAGAGVVDHLHVHVVPRWLGDTNFMPILAEVQVIPEHLARTSERLRALF